MTKPKVVWLADVPGWAYHNRAKRLIERLPAFDHVIVFNAAKFIGKALQATRDADVIVCPDPRLLRIFPWRGNVVQSVNAIKIFK